MALPVALGVGLTVGVAPRTNRIFYDEQIYQNVGQNLADLRRAQMCNDGAVDRREAALLDRRIQQAAVRLSACPQPGLSRRRRWHHTGVRDQRRGDGTIRLLRLPARRARVRGSRRGVLRRAAARAHAGAAGLVGDRRGRTLGFGRVSGGASGDSVLRAIAEHGLARRRGGCRGLRGPVSTGVVADRTGGRVARLAAVAGGIRAPATVVGGPGVPRSRRRPSGAHRGGRGTKAGARRRRACRWTTSRPTCA